MPSLPPDAQSEPSGETVTVVMYPVWPKWLVRSLHLLSSQTWTRREWVRGTCQ